MYSFLYLFLLFFIYSIIGYIIEIINCSLIEKKLVLSRGYMIGPYIPIYGVGAITVIYLLDKYKHDLVALFIMGMFICTLIEYLTSFLMEKLFKLRWWDYSNKKFNINGRVCLENGVLFGIGGVIIVKFINPYIISFLDMFSDISIIIIGLIIVSLFIVDLIESTYIICHLKINISKYINKDATMTIKREVIRSFKKHRTFTNRLLKAFPNVKEVRNGKIDIRKVLKKMKKKSRDLNEK